MDTTSTTIYLSPEGFFQQAVAEAVKERNISAYPMTERYLVEVLEHYLFTTNLFREDQESGELKRETLAELYLNASNSEREEERTDMFKRLGDSSLYVSGFFGDSLQRKIIDIDYYIDMGCSAYNTLASFVKDELGQKVFRELARKFSDFVEVFAYISAKTLTTSNQSLLRLFEVYAKTGSQIAKETLLKNGIILPDEAAFKKANNQ
jgi:hypothetical protein